MKTPNHNARAQRGSALAAVVIFVLIASALAGTVAVLTAQSARLAQRTVARERALVLADAHLDFAYEQWRAICRERPFQARPGSDFASIAAPPASDVPLNGFRRTRYDLGAMNLVTAATGPGAPSRLEKVRMSGSASVDAAWYYEAAVDLEADTSSGAPIVVRARRIFEKTITSPWRKLAMFNGTLEIHPGPDMDLDGAVHTNGDLYVITGGGTPGSNVIFYREITHVGDYFMRFMDGEMWRRGFFHKVDGVDTINYGAMAAIKKPTYLNGHSPQRTSYEAPFGIFPDQFDRTDDNPNNDSYREIIERPDPNYPDTFQGSGEPGDVPRMYNQAGIKIEVDAAGTIVFKDIAGDVIPPSATGPAKKLLEAFSDAVNVGKTLQDNREGAVLRLIEIDLSKTKLPGSGFNGVVYVTDTSASASARRGVKLINGAELSQSLTVVSDNPVYIQGDYNTGNGNASKKVASAVMADAVTILSNAWTDAKSSLDLSARKATETRVNAAILSGVVPSEINPSRPRNSRYSGGFENFPRFLENWNAVNFWYRGSMVSLFNSEQSTGAWGKGNVYNPPRRRWFFETDFLTNPPPGIFVTVQYSKQKWSLASE